jgi:hypothetical protein
MNGYTSSPLQQPSSIADGNTAEAFSPLPVLLGPFFASNNRNGTLEFARACYPKKERGLREGRPRHSAAPLLLASGRARNLRTNARRKNRRYANRPRLRNYHRLPESPLPHCCLPRGNRLRRNYRLDSHRSSPSHMIGALEHFDKLASD